MVDFLLDHGADISARNADGATPLNEAVRLNNRSILDCLLGRGADVNTANYCGDTPLFTVVNCLSFNSVEIIQQLVEYGAKLDERNDNGETLLHAAVKIGATDVVSFLVSTRPELVDAVDQDGNLPIHFDQAKGTLEILIGVRGELLGVSNDVGASPISTLLKCVFSSTTVGVDDVIKTMTMMLDKYPPLGSRPDVFGNTPFHYAAIYTETLRDGSDLLNKVLDALIIRKCDINVGNTYGQTALHLCRNEWNIDAFLRRGAKADMRDSLGRTVLHHLMLARVCHISIFSDRAPPSNALDRLTASDGALVQDFWLRTPVHYIEYAQQFDVRDSSDLISKAKLLDELVKIAGPGGVVDVRDRFDRTPLHYAYYAGHQAHVDTLLQAGADSDAVDIDGVTPRQLQRVAEREAASRAGHQHIASQLFGKTSNINRQAFITFQRMRRAGNLSVCGDDCRHRRSGLETCCRVCFVCDRRETLSTT